MIDEDEEKSQVTITERLPGSPPPPEREIPPDIL